jgi:hypothetical protein
MYVTDLGPSNPFTPQYQPTITNTIDHATTSSALTSIALLLLLLGSLLMIRLSKSTR